MGTYLRKSRTTQERRANGRRNGQWIEDFCLKMRPSRNMANLPNSWDDIVRRDLKDRSWKHHRLTQYKSS